MQLWVRHAGGTVWCTERQCLLVHYIWMAEGHREIECAFITNVMFWTSWQWAHSERVYLRLQDSNWWLWQSLLYINNLTWSPGHAYDTPTIANVWLKLNIICLPVLEPNLHTRLLSAQKGSSVFLCVIVANNAVIEGLYYSTDRGSNSCGKHIAGQCKCQACETFWPQRSFPV